MPTGVQSFHSTLSEASFQPKLRLAIKSAAAHTGSIRLKAESSSSRRKRGWSDADLASLSSYFDRVYHIYSQQKLKAALLTAASERSFHPVREYLESLPPWDGVKRLDTLLIDYLGAADSPYTRAVIRKALIAAVTRVYRPGAKFDYILVLSGPQGVGKSTLFSRLGGSFFSASGSSESNNAVSPCNCIWRYCTLSRSTVN